MTVDGERQRAAAICESCGTVRAVHLGSDGEIRPIGSGRGVACTCGGDNFRILSADAEVLDDVDM